MNDEIPKSLRRLEAGLAELYGERLRGVYLFGSCARGEDVEASDIDVLIVLDHVEHYPQEIDRTSELVAELSLQCGRSISRVFVSERRWREGQAMSPWNVREQAVPA